MTDKERIIAMVNERIAGFSSASNIDMLNIKDLQTVGYLQALEDVGLLDSAEIEELSQAADKASDETAHRLAEAAKTNVKKD